MKKVILDATKLVNKLSRELQRNLQTLDGNNLSQAIEIAERLEDLHNALSKYKHEPVPRIRSSSSAIAELEEIYSRKVWVEDIPAFTPSFKVDRHAPKKPKEKKPKERTYKEPAIPYGTFGIWDYPNPQWASEPTIDDIPEIMLQKRFRAPGNGFWCSEDRMLEWFKVKGWID